MTVFVTVTLIETSFLYSKEKVILLYPVVVESGEPQIPGRMLGRVAACIPTRTRTDSGLMPNQTSYTPG